MLVVVVVVVLVLSRDGILALAEAFAELLAFHG